MARFFTQSWSNSACDVFFSEGQSGVPVNHTAGSDFSKRGITDGDTVYIVNVFHGQLVLIGRMVVEGKILNFNQAKKKLGPDIWQADEHLIAREGSGTPMFFTRGVDAETVEALRCISARGDEVPLKFEKPEVLDRQTLRAVRELTPASAALLDEVLDEPYEESFEDHPDEEDDENDVFEAEWDDEENEDENEKENENGDDDDDDDDDDEDDEESDIADEDLEEIIRQYGDEEQNLRIEMAAVAVVRSYFASEGWTVTSREEDYCGYDLLCAKGGQELHLKVKGMSDDELRFIMTDHEFKTASLDDDYLVCVVTRAESDDAELSFFDPDEMLDEFNYRPTEWAFQFKGEEEID
ncbi:MAG: DUF3883 domain-containing protein [Bacteroidota bacterium]|jgi:hypothetical protein